VRITAGALMLMLGAAAACGGGGAAARAHPAIVAAAGRDAVAIADALEALIADGRDTPEDRAYAYEAALRAPPADTAADAFARAAVIGRLVQARGLTASHLVAEVERHARRSRALDPGYRGGAATRMLGTLYVLAPSALLEHGDSEEGLTLLTELAAARPDVPENHLRLGEALLALGERDSAGPPLCRAAAARSSLRRDEQGLLDRLLEDAGRPRCSGAFLPAERSR
jgi:hypothetical protein